MTQTILKPTELTSHVHTPTPDQPGLSPVLEPLGAGAGDFFLAASLYHAHKISFSAAAALSGLSFEEFHYRLKEHFGAGFTVDDESVLEDLQFVKDQRDRGA